MIPTLRVSLLLVLLLLGAVVLPHHVGAETRPNMVFILADDLSWSDLGCYGHRYHDTPQLDKLAREGLRFTQAYAPAPIFSASRAAKLRRLLDDYLHQAAARLPTRANHPTPKQP
ncbi:MAG: sulfatase-like hydrolase/transferase [Prosthecobacter sp.]|nr:sulfatase-like hydrolase/transferase [Prosthecobacter sp.]